MVRDAVTGLCYHVDLNGSKIYSHKGYSLLLLLFFQLILIAGFLDIDVFHKGFARARDSSGWFHINTKGEDISKGTRSFLSFSVSLPLFLPPFSFQFTLLFLFLSNVYGR